MRTESMIAKVPDSPAGHQLRWLLGLLLLAGDGALASDYAHYTPEVRPQVAGSDEEERTWWRDLAARIGAVSELSVESSSDFRIEAVFTAAKNRRWRFSVTVEEQSPHRIAQIELQRQYDFKFEIRDATEGDAAVLAEIERRSPIEQGDRSICFDRGDDYFAATRFMEDVTVVIASVNGVPAAAGCGALHKVKIGGVLHPIVSLLHFRVLPEHQRKGLNDELTGRALSKYQNRIDGTLSFIEVDNVANQHAAAYLPNKWTNTVLRLHLPCAALAGPATGRSATPADAPAIAEILNSCHEREELFVPYGAESLRSRLERAPKQYSWDRVWMTDSCVVGVWPAGESIKVVINFKGTRIESRRGLVLDYGFMPGAEDELEGVLRAWCARLAESGLDTLAMFTSPASPGSELLCLLASHVEPFNVWTPGIPEPPGSAERGIYVDPIYF